MPVFGSYPMEGAMLKFKSGPKNYIYDDLYTNSGQIKDFLNKVVVKKTEPKDWNHGSMNTEFIDDGEVDIFKGKLWASTYGLGFWGAVALFFLAFYFGKTEMSRNGWIILAFSSVFLALVFGNCTYYFSLSEKHLLLKNHYPFWPKKAYELSNVKEVVLETAFG